MKTKPSVPAVAYDPRSFIIRGRRELLISGEIHYARSPRAQWPAILDRTVACGLNGVASYVFWNWHEPERGVYNFAGDHDLGHFLSLCAERRLFVLLRIGPYCCAEWNYGGYPPWLRDEPGITIRTWNEPYLRRVEGYFEHLLAEIRPYLATRGGPVILVQAENEYANVAKRYGPEGQRYLAWMAALTRRLGVDVPIIMCEGGAPGVIETVNGFSISAERSAAFRDQHPELPMFWTELWPAWYNTWGFQEHLRDPRNIAFHILHFLALGGCGWNYYMWHGGTNFGRRSMYLQATSYGFDAGLDEFGRISTKGSYLGELHHILRENQDFFLAGERRLETLPSGVRHATWRAGNRTVEMVLNPQKQAAAGPSAVPISPRCAVLFDGMGHRVFETHETYVAVNDRVRAPRWRKAAALAGWRCWPEPLPAERPDSVCAPEPQEQLALTRDASDYCWYSTSFTAARAGRQALTLTYGGDFFYVFVDGHPVARTQTPLRENRGPTLPTTPEHPRVAANALENEPTSGFRHEFHFRTGNGEHRLDILACALGLIKGDWQIADSMNWERKGIWQPVLLNGRALRNWEMRPSLCGELRRLADAGFVNLVTWQSLPATPRHLTWYMAEFDVATRLLQSAADFRLDAHGLGKGMLFVNGHALGRHWLVPGHGYGPDGAWVDMVNEGLYLGPPSVPTQRYYQVPRSWLQRRNRLLILEEQAAEPRNVHVQVRG